MLFKPDCIQCILKVSISAMRRFISQEEMMKTLSTDILKIPSMQGLDWNITPPEVFELVIEKIVGALNDPDPFRSMKAQQNKKAMELYPWAKEVVTKASDPLYLAVKFAIVGNSLDLIISDGSVEIEGLIQERLKVPIPEERLLKFRNKLKGSKLLLYFGDNSGEIIFDKLLIETIKQEYNLDVVYVVRSDPTFNDATYKEAKAAGIDKIASVLENGIDGALPGTILSRCSKEVRDLFHSADLIISKGTGNFDTLDEEKHHNKDIVFMFMCKCVPYSNTFGSKLHDPILYTPGPPNGA